MPFLRIFFLLFLVGTISPAYGQEQQKIPDQVYSDLEYIFSLSQTETDIEPHKISKLIQFISTVSDETGLTLKERKGASGSFYSFSIDGSLSKVLDYVYNPDIPSYVTMPSSLQGQEWLTPDADEALRDLPAKAKSDDKIHVLRGREREIITPDTNTGGYYKYIQDRVITILPGPTGPVLISASSQIDMSDVGKKGCVVGDDKNWNYLYSDETGLNKTGLGWVDSYMYQANSIIIYVMDTSKNMLHVGSFKWLNAGWAKINMVKSSHILAGQKRFSSDFKAILEAPSLPEPQVLADKYRELQHTSDHELRQMILPHLQAMHDSGDLSDCSRSVKGMVSSGEYLQQMSQEEMVRVILLEYIKENIGRESLGKATLPSSRIRTLASRP